MRHSKFTRTLAVFMTFVLTFSLLPTLTPKAKAANWTDTTIAGITTFSSTETITVTGTVTITGVIVIQNPGTVVTITGGGTLVRGNNSPITTSGGNSVTCPIFVYNGAKLILDNITIDGKMETYNTTADFSALIYSNGGNIEMYADTVLKNNRADYGGGVYVGGGGSFTMNGGKINVNSAPYGGGVCVSTGSTFIMNDGEITGNTASSRGGGVYVVSSGSFTMNGGTITGNESNVGGGVFVAAATSATSGIGTFNMTAGTISGNKATTTTAASGGGGVYAAGDVTYGSSVFTMSGGTITENESNRGGGGVFAYGNVTISGGAVVSNNTAGGTSGNGGGVYVYNYGVLNLNGGYITGNTAITSGGGVYVNGTATDSGVFTMSGGTINGNNANTNGGGVYVTASGTFTIPGGSGQITITGNTRGTAATANNVYLVAGKTVEVSDALNTATMIGVTTPTITAGSFFPVTSGTYSFTVTDNFTSDNSNYSVILNAGVVELINPFKVTYGGNGNTGGSVPTDSNLYKNGATVTVLSNGSLVRTGYTFDGWNTLANGSGTPRAAGSTFSISVNTTLYARWLANITTAAITVTAPTTGATPNTTAGGTGNFTIGSVSWSPGDATFAVSTAYTAEVTLTANSGYTFAGLTTATINGSAATVISNSGSAVTLSYSFPATGQLTPTGVTWPTASGLTYGDALAASILTGGLGAGTFAWTDDTILPKVINSGYSVTFTPTDSTTYETLTQTTGITVAPLQLTIIAPTGSPTKVYDGGTDYTGTDITLGSLANKVAADTVSVSVASADYNSKDVTSSDQITLTYSISGIDAGNYLAPANDTITASITPKTLTVTDAEVNDKTYDGTDAASFAGTPSLAGVLGADVVTLAAGTPFFVSVGVGNGLAVSFTPAFSISGADSSNYTLTQPTGITANIVSGFAPVKGTHYTAGSLNTSGWTNTDFVITALAGYLVSLTDTAVGDPWTSSLTFSAETGTGSVTFYVKDTDTGEISVAKTEYYKLDKTAPSGEITVITKSFPGFIDTITFGMIFKNTVSVSITGSDAISGISTIEYLATDVQFADTATAAAAGGWIAGSSVSLLTGFKGVVYARITDNAGNVSIINSDGIVVYEDSSQITDSISHIRGGAEKTADIDLNGNTIDKINDGTIDLTPTAHYTVSGDVITFTAAYLDALTPGSYTLTIHYNPLGEMYVSHTDNERPDTTVIALDIANPVPKLPPDTSSTSTPTPAPNSDVTVFVDGRETSAGDVTVGSDKITVVVNQDILNNEIESANDNVKVVIPSGTGTAETQFVVKNVDDMAEKAMTLTVVTEYVQYQIPGAAIDTVAIMASLGADDTTQVPVNVAITTNVSAETQSLVDSAIDSGAIVFPPIEFVITATYNGKITEVTEFSQYVNRTVEITEEQAKKVTTAVVIEPDGTIRHVPTNVHYENGTWYATINSLTNSVYALIMSEVAFTDTTGKWYEAAVNEMGSRDVIVGIGNGLFAGERDVTRAEFAAIVVRALGLPAKADISAFSDIYAGAWYAGAVNKAYEYGLVSGIGGGMYAPDRPITREEAMVLIWRAAQLAGFSGSVGSIDDFPDVGNVSDWAQTAARWNVGTGLIVGSNGMLRPKENISRAETAVLVLRLLREAELVDNRA